MILHAKNKLLEELEQAQKNNESIGCTILVLQDEVKAKDEQITAKDEQITTLSENVQSLSLHNDLLKSSNKTLKKSFFNPAVYSKEDWSNLKTIRPYIQGTLRQIAAFLTSLDDDKDSFVLKVEEMLKIDYSKVKISRVISPVTAYMMICNGIKARYFCRRKIRDPVKKKRITSSFIDVNEYYFVMVRFQQLLLDEEEYEYADYLNSTLGELEKQFRLSKRVVEEEQTVVVKEWL